MHCKQKDSIPKKHKTSNLPKINDHKYKIY